MDHRLSTGALMAPKTCQAFVEVFELGPPGSSADKNGIVQL